MMTKHFPIWLKGWGKEVDYNLFPDSVSLALAYENNTDKNSVYGNPLFVSPEEGNFSVEESSPAIKLGIVNFPMDSFGVQKPELKAIAKQPDIHQLNIASLQKIQSKTREWLGATLKNIETPEEQSASGLHSINGVIVLKVKEGSKLSTAGINEGDVIIAVEKKKIKNITSLLANYQENLWHGSVKFTIVRHQKEMGIIISVSKKTVQN
ncbi:MAG: PDZ domain-containing protein [Bacteroidetes bacterium]|jgi:hypothetical protein|nr:PDZ domain-containing protein [Bacteroidota bacterium]MBT6685118.1 PDZ domain-containing protein [Bacteroidota bacterium]MBT7142278.1 PDZ domain-containing protein [Bacteroidota bacterium]MBT7491710.1 PDZ domain-containing protein [Bacteroidota bacterium]